MKMYHADRELLEYGVKKDEIRQISIPDTPPTFEAQLWFNRELNMFCKLAVDFILSNTWKNNLW